MFILVNIEHKLQEYLCAFSELVQHPTRFLMVAAQLELAVGGIK